VPGETALVLRGLKGSGKSTLGNLIREIVGEHSYKISRRGELTGDFSGHLKNKIFLQAEEAVWAGDRKGEGVLKDLITAHEISVRALYRDAELNKNRLHILMTSNEDWVVPATMGDERRFCVMEVSPIRVGDHIFWKRVHEQAEMGGLAAMLHDLLKRDISGFVPSAVPLTDALADQKEHSLGVEGEWLINRLESGRTHETEVLEGNSDWHAGPVVFDRDVLYGDYSEFARSRGTRRPFSKNVLGKFLYKVEFESKQIRTRRNRGKWGWEADLYKIRAKLEQMLGKKLFVDDMLS
jgi:hypothetical protein